MLLKKLLKFYLFIVFLLFGKLAHCQYSISGQLNANQQNKRVYLSLLKFDGQTLISSDQVLTSTLTDSLGYYAFEGKLLYNKSALYRIHCNVDEYKPGMEMIDIDSVKNFKNFIFSNKDTIRFIRNDREWFSITSNTNPTDKEWRAFGDFGKKLRDEFSDFTSSEIINESSTQFLHELKTYSESEKVHPLATLILLSGLPYNSLQSDLKTDSDFYTSLQNELNLYYENKTYALQFEALLNNLTIALTREQLVFYKNLSYGSITMCILLALILIYFLKNRDSNQTIITETTNLNITGQEQRVAELIVANKTNKEIASELFISMNTLKTHIRSIYGKFGVSNRREFVEKFKNHPRC